MAISSKDEVLQLLQTRLGNDSLEDKAAVLALIDALVYSPLAICQAATNITRQSHRTCVSTYLSEFTNTIESLDRGLDDPYTSVENPIKTTLQITSRQNLIKRNLNTYALPFMSFYDPKFIPISTLQSYALDVPHETGSLQLSPDMLREYLASSKAREPEMFGAYPNLQLYVQKLLLSSSATQCWIRGLFAAATGAHGPLLSLASKLEILHGNEILNLNGSVSWSKLQNNFRIFRVPMGNHSQASWISERGVGANVRKLGSGHTEALRSIDNSVFVLRRQGRLVQTEE